jgi:hypothetical protein
MERAVKFFVAVLVAAVIGGCSSQRSGESGSFYHRKEVENVYVIGFNGNGTRNSERAHDFMMLLAAEIGNKLGYAYFVVKEQQDGSQARIAEKVAPAGKPGRVTGSGHAVASRTTPGKPSNHSPANKPGVEIRVLYSKKVPRGNPREVYAIHDVIRFVKSRYKITS